MSNPRRLRPKLQGMTSPSARWNRPGELGSVSPSSSPSGRPILVTGSHRSGTSWVGQMLARSATTPVAYLFEPFSPLHRPGVCAASFPLWFTYICEENERDYADAIADTLTYRYRTGLEIRSLRSPKDVARTIRDRRRFAMHRRRDARPLMKDPIAVLSAGWLADQFDMDVVVMVRHPGAFAGSLKKLGWRHPFDHFLHQPLLMRNVLGPFEHDIRSFADRERPVVDQAILLWNVLNYAILRAREEHPGWTVLRLEDVARAPLVSFHSLYERLGLGFDLGAARVIQAHTGQANPAESREPSDVRLDSWRSLDTWRARLSEQEIRRVRSGVGEIASAFYSEADWEPLEGAHRRSRSRLRPPQA